MFQGLDSVGLYARGTLSTEVEHNPGVGFGRAGLAPGGFRVQRKSSWGAVWGRPGALNLGFLSRLGCGSLLQGPGLHAREEEEASAVCTHHLSCTGRGG